MIDVRAIAQEHVSQRPPVLVLAVGLERHVLTKDQLRDGLLRPLAVSLAFSGQSMPLRRMRSAR